MLPPNRRVEDVIGNDPAMMQYWDTVSPKIQELLLNGQNTYASLGELQMACENLDPLTKEPPAVF